MLHNCKAEVTIKKVENGFILEWEYERPKESPFTRGARGDDWRDPSGIEIVTDYKGLEKRLRALL